MKVRELKTEMDGKFAAIDQTLEVLRQRIDERIKSEAETTRRDFDERIWSEGETIRRYFDVVAEKMLSERNLGLDRSMATAQQLTGLTEANAADHVRFERRLDDQDQRLQTIERGRDTDPQ